jgi:hypothetical protein
MIQDISHVRVFPRSTDKYFPSLKDLERSLQVPGMGSSAFTISVKVRLLLFL